MALTPGLFSLLIPLHGDAPHPPSAPVYLHAVFSLHTKLPYFLPPPPFPLRVLGALHWVVSMEHLRQQIAYLSRDKVIRRERYHLDVYRKNKYTLIKNVRYDATYRTKYVIDI